MLKQGDEAPMPDSRQRAYLDAMGIEVWSLRHSPDQPSPDTLDEPGIKLGPGDGGILLICTHDTDSASRLANDIERALGNVPVWAWPQKDQAPVHLKTAVDEHLFTTVAIFGEELASRFYAGELPGNVNSAKLVLLPSMQDIQSSPAMRKRLWKVFCRSGMVDIN